MEGIIRTPSSILRKRANKENESNREGKRPKLPSRRVSFAPDEELSTMHLYQKKDDSEDQVQVTEDLAAHMPYGAPNPLLPLQDTTNANAINAHAAVAAAPAAALTPHNNQLIQLDGATGDLFSPLSMDLTNNSFELQRHQHQQLLPYPQRSPQIMPPPPPAPPAPPAFVPQPPMPSEYTRNITSAIPALSTLVEEDEEGFHEGGSAMRPNSHSQQQQQEEEDMDLSMYSTQGAPQEGDHRQAGHPAEGDGGLPGGGGGLPGEQQQSQQQEEGLPESPRSPFACNRMGLRAEAGEDGLDDSENMKNKWGFTPGADDTLDVSHGRQLMGDNTYNHVYGNGTTGDITKAFRTNQGSLNAVALRLQQANNAGARQSLAIPPQPHSPLPPKPQGRLQLEGAEQALGHPCGAPERLHDHHYDSSHIPPPLSHAANGADTDAAGAPAATGAARRRSSVGFGGGRASLGQPEVTISLLAEDSAPGDTWQPQPSIFMGQPSGAALLAPSIPSRLQAGNTHSETPAAVAAAAAAAPTARGPTDTPAHNHNNTTALLGSNTMTAHLPPPALHTQGAGPPLALGPSTGGGANGGIGMGGSSAAPPTTTGFTMQLLADGIPSAHEGGAGSNPSAHQAGTGSNANEQLLRQLHAQLPPAPTSALKPPLPPSARKQGPPSAMKQQQQQQPSSALKLPAQRTPAQLFGGAGGGGGPKQLFGGAGGGGGPQQLFGEAGSGGGNAAHGPDHTATGGNTTWALAAAGAAAERNHEHLTSGSFVAAAAALPLPAEEDGQGAAAHSAPPISFQDFLGIVEVRFLDDMRRRTSLMQPYDGAALLSMAAEAKPQNLVEGVELLHVRGVRACLQQQTINELSERVEALQVRLTSGEAALARENPPVFQYVQVAEPAELDCLRDQVKLLKRACRHRTMINWKQERIKQEQALSAGFRSSFGAIEIEAKYMAGVLEEATSIEAQMNAMHAAVLRSVQQDQTNTKAAQLKKERLAYQQQRITEVTASNETRQQKLEAVREQRRLVQERYEAAMQQKASLQAALQGLHDQGFQQGTPTKSARNAHSSGSMATTEHLQQLAGRQEALDVLVGLQGISLDVCSLRSSNTWSMTVLNRFQVTVDMAGSLSGEPRTCAVHVVALPAAFQGSEVARTLLPGVEALIAHAIPDVHVSKLPSVMDQLLYQFGSVAQNLAQLEAAHIRLPHFGRLELVLNQEGAPPALCIWFLAFEEPSKCAKLGVSLPLSSLTGELPYVAPALQAHVLLPTQDARMRSTYAASLMNRISPSHSYIQQLCTVANQLVASGLPVSGEPCLGQGSVESEEGLTCLPCPVTPHPALRMLDNPLFT